MIVPKQKGNTEISCELCGEVFTVKNSLLRYRAKNDQSFPRFCSTKCWKKEETSETVELSCLVCKKLFKAPGYRVKAAKNLCCSYECMGIWKKTGTDCSCAECGKRVYVSGHRMRRHKTYFCQNSCRLSYQFRNNKSWEGFVSSSTEYRKLVGRIRKSSQAMAWKNAVLDRDRSCTKCGSADGLNAHHITSLIKIIADNDFDETKSLQDPRLVDVSNGATLCGDCHADHHGLQSRHEETRG